MAYDDLFSKVAILCPMDGANGATTIPEIKGAALTAIGAAKLNTGVLKFGTACLDLITGGYVTGYATNASSWTDFAIQCWVYVPTGISGQIATFGNYSLTVRSDRALQVNVGGSSWWGASGQISENTWSFLKLDIISGVANIRCNGGSALSNATTGAATGTAGTQVTIGAAHGGGTPFSGYIDDIRITAGDGRTSENLTVPSTAFPTQGMPAIIGNVNVKFTPNAYHTPLIYILNGYVNTIHSLVSELAHFTPIGILSGMVVSRSTPISNMVKVSKEPVGIIGSRYVGRLSDAEDLAFSVISFEAGLSASGDSFLRVVTGLPLGSIDNISIKYDGKIIISRVLLLSDDTSITQDFINVNYNGIGYKEETANNGIVLLGTKKIKVTSSKIVVIRVAISREYRDNIISYTCEINSSLSIGDNLVINGESLIVGSITYNMAANTGYMIVTQYVATGSEVGAEIGGNSLPEPLIEYSVTVDNLLYAAYVDKAFFYNGLSNTGFNIGRAYSLYHDADGWLWYLNGYAGHSNIPVLKVDNVTQENLHV
jgi:hypothetical protein